MRTEFETAIEQEKRERRIQTLGGLKWLTASAGLAILAYTAGSCAYKSFSEADNVSRQISAEWFTGLTQNQLNELGQASARAQMLGSDLYTESIINSYREDRLNFYNNHPQKPLVDLKSHYAGSSTVNTLGLVILLTMAGYKFFKTL